MEDIVPRVNLTSPRNQQQKRVPTNLNQWCPILAIRRLGQRSDVAVTVCLWTKSSSRCVHSLRCSQEVTVTLDRRQGPQRTLHQAVSRRIHPARLHPRCQVRHLPSRSHDVAAGACRCRKSSSPSGRPTWLVTQPTRSRKRAPLRAPRKFSHVCYQKKTTLLCQRRNRSSEQ